MGGGERKKDEWRGENRKEEKEKSFTQCGMKIKMTSV